MVWNEISPDQNIWLNICPTPTTREISSWKHTGKPHFTPTTFITVNKWKVRHCVWGGWQFNREPIFFCRFLVTLASRHWWLAFCQQSIATRHRDKLLQNTTPSFNHRINRITFKQLLTSISVSTNRVKISDISVHKSIGSVNFTWLIIWILLIN